MKKHVKFCIGTRFFWYHKIVRKILVIKYYLVLSKYPLYEKEAHTQFIYS